MNDRITREQMVMQSVTTYVRAALFDDRGYPEDQIDLLDAFPHEQIQAGQPSEKTAIAVGFNFDDQGTPLELGSSLKRRIYTIELFVFGVHARVGGEPRARRQVRRRPRRVDPAARHFGSGHARDRHASKCSQRPPSISRSRARARGSATCG
jgi:hypothetical protein